MLSKLIKSNLETYCDFMLDHTTAVAMIYVRVTTSSPPNTLNYSVPGRQVLRSSQRALGTYTLQNELPNLGGTIGTP